MFMGPDNYKEEYLKKMTSQQPFMCEYSSPIDPKVKDALMFAVFEFDRPIEGSYE
jgi:hypothetical protein